MRATPLPWKIITVETGRMTKRTGPRPGEPSVADLEPDEAAEVLRRLAARGDAVGEAVREAIRSALLRFDPDAVTDEVRDTLESLTVEDIWDRSGPRRDGYTDPGEAAWEILEECLEPYLERIRTFQRLNQPERARDYCVAVLAAIDGFDRESDSEFKKHSVDGVGDAFAWVLDEAARGAKTAYDRADLRGRTAERFG
jgi:hypothetical protein